MAERTSASVATEFIPLCVPEIRGNEWKYVKECLDTGWVSSVGAFVNRFERELAAYVGARHAVAAVNGTAALHIALQVAGVEPDDEVVVSTLTFIAPVNAIRYVGAWPVFMDAEPDYWQLDVNKLRDFLHRECEWKAGQLRNRSTGRRVRALLPVHVLGHPVDMDPILELAKQYSLLVIEDATECLGARYKANMAGTLGDIAVFSFNGNKIITCGGGGMIVTDNEQWAAKATYLTTQAKDDAIEFVHNEIGYNYRLTNLQAAAGCGQLELLPEFITLKRRIAANYERVLGQVPGVTVMREAPWAFSIYWMFTVLFDAQQFGADSRQVLNHLRQARIETRPLWRPIHLNAPYRACQAYHCDTAERLNRDALSLPCSVGLTPQNQDHVIEQVLSRAAQRA